MHATSGRVAVELAAHFENVLVCAPVVNGPPPSPDDLLLEAAKLEFIAQPPWRTTLEALPHIFGIAGAYLRTCRRADVLFIRGMCPYITLLYLFALVFHLQICHWIVGDPVALLRTGLRRGPILDRMALLYALQHRMFSRLGRWFTGGAFICNGRELAHAYASPRTISTVSSTVQDGEFFARADTCQGSSVRILFLGYIRPEKGIEYLLDAVSTLRADVPWELEIAGPDEFPEYRRQLDQIVATRGIHGRVSWTGYASYGEAVFERMRAADIFVLPTLSEGTPHVLVEARANSLPCISTTVGGVPSTVTDGHDALLVPPKNPRALAQAIERVVRDGELRRSLIRNGLASARKQTLESFISTVRMVLETSLEPGEAAIPQE